jgi:hypothetical protein
MAVSVGSMVSHTFELDGFKRPFAVVLGLIVIPTGVILLQLAGC